MLPRYTSELGSCVNVEVGVLFSSSLIDRMVCVDTKQHSKKKKQKKTAYMALQWAYPGCQKCL